MSEKERRLYKNLDELVKIELSPSENHLLAVLASMDSVPPTIHARIHAALENINAQQVTKDAAVIFMGQPSEDASEAAQDVYTYVNLWAGKEQAA